MDFCILILAFVLLYIENQRFSIQSAYIRELAAILMIRYLLFILISFQSCNGNSTEMKSTETKFSFLDSIRNQCQFANILFQTNYPNGKVLLEARQFIGKSQIDSLFSFIGDPVFDTTSNFSIHDRVGKISLCMDSLGRINLLDLDFYFNNKFEGYKETSSGDLHSFKFTTLGKKTLLALYDKVKPKL